MILSENITIWVMQSFSLNILTGCFAIKNCWDAPHTLARKGARV